MTRLYLVRHGQEVGKWSETLDPDLTPQGRAQAQDVAPTIAQKLPQPVRIVASPMARCRQTAQPLAQLWETEPQIAAEVIEVPAPDKKTSTERAVWLRDIFHQNWGDVRDEPALVTWRQNLLNWLLSCKQDTVVFTHFVAINVAVGAACGDDRLISRWPAHCSIWLFETDGTRLRLVDAGREIETKVL